MFGQYGQFGQIPFSNPYEQLFGGYPVHPLQQQLFGLPHQQANPMGGLAPFGQQMAGIGPIGPLVPQQSGFPLIPQASPIPFGHQANVSPFLPAQVSASPLEQVLGIGAMGQY